MCRDLFGKKREFYKSDIKKVRVTTKNGRKSIFLFNEEKYLFKKNCQQADMGK